MSLDFKNPIKEDSFLKSATPLNSQLSICLIEKIQFIQGEFAMYEYFRRELPPGELIVDPTWKTFKNFGVQWSKLIAW